MIDLAKMAKLYGLPDMGLDDPRIEPFLHATVARYHDLTGETADQFLVDLAIQTVSTKFMAELSSAGAKATELSDDDLTILMEQATDTAMIRHFGAKKRMFPTKLASSSKAQIRPAITQFLNKSIDARRTGAQEARHARRIAQAARLVASEIISIPIAAEQVFEIEDILIEEVVYAASRKSIGFMEVGDAELILLTENARDAKSAKISRIIRAAAKSFEGG